MIENLIFDFGYVLAYPRNGNWFLTPESRKLVTKGDIIRIALHLYRRNRVLASTRIHLNEDHRMVTEEREIEHFTIFYQKLLTGFGIKKDVIKKSNALAEDLVLNDQRVGIYEDVLTELPVLKENYRISILSDNWPSLRRLLKNYRIEEHLSGLIISSDYGICKDNVELFRIAAAELKLRPECSIFVDDSEKNLINAEQLGFHPVLMDRKRTCKASRFPIVHDIRGVAEIADQMNKGGEGA